MLAYPVAEAETLLESKLATAQQSLENCEEDLDFLREQITVSFTCIHLGFKLNMFARLSRWRLLDYTIGR